MALTMDSNLIFEKYIHSRTILESSILTESYKQEDVILESLLEEGLGDFFRKVGTGVKSVASSLKDRLMNAIAGSISKLLSPEEAHKALEMIDNGTYPTSEIKHLAKSVFSNKTVNESFYIECLNEELLTDLLCELVLEAKAKSSLKAKMSPEDALAKMQAQRGQRQKKNATRRKTPAAQTTPTPSPTEQEPEVEETVTPQEQLKVKQYINGLVDLINSKYKTPQKRAKVYSAIDAKVRSRLGQDVNDMLKKGIEGDYAYRDFKDQVFTQLDKIKQYKPANMTNAMNLAFYIGSEFNKFVDNKGLEGDRAKLLSDIFDSVNYELNPPKDRVIDTGEAQQKIKAEAPKSTIPKELIPFKEWYKIAIQSVPELKQNTLYIKFKAKILDLVDEKNKIEKWKKMIGDVGSPNVEEPKQATTEQPTPQSGGLLSKIWSWVKEHKTLTASSVVALLAIVAYASGGTSLLLPLLYKGLKSTASGGIGVGISAAKQYNDSGKVDWKRAAKAGAVAGLGSMAISMAGGLVSNALDNAFADNTTDNTDSTPDKDNSPEEDTTTSEEQPLATGNGELADDTEELFKKLNKTEFNPNSRLDLQKKDIIDNLKLKNVTGKDFINQYNQLASRLQRSPKNYSW